MRGYETVRDDLREGRLSFSRLEAVQLIKHALGLQTTVQRKGAAAGKLPVLLYLYAEPQQWPDGRVISASECSYRELLGSWTATADPLLKLHAGRVLDYFKP